MRNKACPEDCEGHRCRQSAWNRRAYRKRKGIRLSSAQISSEPEPSSGALRSWWPKLMDKAMRNGYVYRSGVPRWT